MSSKQDADDFLKGIQELISAAASNREETKEAARAFDEAIAAIGVDSDVTFNARVNKGLRDEFDLLCKKNHTNMSREVKRYMSLAVSAQKLI